MTPSFRWVFLLALVGRAASVPDPVVVDACALLCNPGAETESERARDPNLYPRYPKVNCHPQSVYDDDQAWRIASHCLKLCNEELTVESEVNCFALRSSLGSNLGCYCEALTPLSPNTMRLHESWRLNFLVKELAKDIFSVILDSPLDMMILCEIHREIYDNYALILPENGQIINKCKNETLLLRSTRSVDENSIQDNVSENDNEIIIEEEEDKDHVERELKIKNLKHDEKSYEKNEEIKEKENKWDTDDGKNTNERDKAKNNVENNNKVNDSEKDNVKDNTKNDAKHSKSDKEDNRNDKERDNAKDNAKKFVKNNKDTTNEEKNDGRILKHIAKNDKKVEEDKSAKNDKKDSKNDSGKDTMDQAEQISRPNDRRLERDTHHHKMKQFDYDEYEMMNDDVAHELKKDKAMKELLTDMIETITHLMEVLTSLILKF